MSRLSLKHLSGERIGIQQISELKSTREVTTGTIWAKDISLVEETKQEPTEVLDPNTTVPQLDESKIINDLHGLPSEEDGAISKAKGFRK